MTQQICIISSDSSCDSRIQRIFKPLICILDFVLLNEFSLQAGALFWTGKIGSLKNKIRDIEMKQIRLFIAHILGVNLKIRRPRIQRSQPPSSNVISLCTWIVYPWTRSNIGKKKGQNKIRKNNLPGIFENNIEPGGKLSIKVVRIYHNLNSIDSSMCCLLLIVCFSVFAFLL